MVSIGRRKNYLRSGLMNDDGDDDNVIYPESLLPEDLDISMQKRISEETLHLAEGRMYMIFDSTSADKVTVRAYDATCSEDITPAHVLLQGIMAIMNSEYEYLMQLGHEETFMQLIAEKERKEGSSRPIEIENI